MSKDIFWDEIVNIEYIENHTEEYVYDFSVNNVETFATSDGLIVHNTLNTFHHAGVSSKSNVNRGVPRIKELISVSKNQKTPSLTIHLKDKYQKKDEAKKILNNIENTDLSYFIDSTSIWYDPDILNSCITLDKQFIKDYYDFHKDIDIKTLSPWVLRIRINPLYLINKDMTMLEIYYILIQKFIKKKLHIIYSDENADEIVIHIRLIHNDINKEEDGYLVTNNDFKTLNTIEENIISNCYIRGLKNINKITMREIKNTKIKKNGSLETKEEIVLDTNGTNLQDIFKMDENMINHYKTFSNDIHEIYTLLGVEAVREVLKIEIMSVLNFSGIYVNSRHLDLLVDSMTMKGGLISMDRHGINKTDAGVLSKISFEEPHEHLVKASMFNIHDNINSITSNIILGQIGKFGTGLCSVKFDEKKFNKYKYENKILDDEEDKVIILSNNLK
jgi:DNA-directed RNA polymerase II subunit RPB1